MNFQKCKGSGVDRKDGAWLAVIFCTRTGWRRTVYLPDTPVSEMTDNHAVIHSCLLQCRDCGKWVCKNNEKSG